MTNFTLGPNATFWYQHDNKFQTSIKSSPFQLTIFDNAAGGYGDAEPYARGILLEVDTNAMTANLVQEYRATFLDVADSQGSVMPTSTGGYFIGFGQQPYYTEYSASGVLLYDVAFASQNSTTQSYRAYRQAWSAQPLTPPSLVVNGTQAYVSWNGATDVASWEMLGGNSSASTSSIGNAAKTGFETVLAVPAGTQLFSVAALAANVSFLHVGRHSD